MKGLELSKRYFAEVALPAIRRDLPECLPHLAVPLTPEKRANLAYVEAEELIPYITAVHQSIADQQIRDAGSTREVLPPASKEAFNPLDPP